MQKCIENPIMWKSRKADFRMWVLVTDFDPLTVWFYEDFYVRAAWNEFDQESIDEKTVLTSYTITGRMLEEEEE